MIGAEGEEIDFAKAPNVAIGEHGVWVTDSANTLYKVDLRENKLVKVLEVPSFEGSTPGMAEGFGSVWVSSFEGNLLWRLNPFE